MYGSKARPKPSLTPAQRKQTKIVRTQNKVSVAKQSANRTFAFQHQRQDAPGYTPVNPTIGPRPDGMSHTRPDGIKQALMVANNPKFKQAMSGAFGKGRGR